MKLHFTLAAIGAAIVAMPAVAAPHEGGAFVADYDTDRDGKVTRAEFDAARTARFEATDTNKDGWVSEDEYVAEYSARLEGQLAASDRSEEKKVEERQRQIRQTHVRFGALDSNKDKKLQKSEFDASGERAFANIDADKDGVVSPQDVEKLKARQIAQRAERDAKEAANQAQ